MAFTIQQHVEVIEVMENYLERIRPGEEIRIQLDFGYRIEGQSVYIFEIRPRWDNPEVIHESNVSKATWVKTRGAWKVFWLRASLKWEIYDPCPFVAMISQFVHLVEEDHYGCFWG
jgi:hypothetical protein